MNSFLLMNCMSTEGPQKMMFVCICMCLGVVSLSQPEKSKKETDGSA